MYTQFFGNFLLSKGYITNEQLFDALKEKVGVFEIAEQPKANEEGKRQKEL